MGRYPARAKLASATRFTHTDYAVTYSEQIAELMATSRAPFQLPWAAGSGHLSMPYNGTSGKAYSGANSFMLSMHQLIAGYADNRWFTFKQGVANKARLRKGSKGVKLVKWVEATTKNIDETEDENAKGRLVPVPFTVFNAEQFDNLAPAMVREAKPEHERHAQCEALVAATGARIFHGGDQAFYRPATDSVHLPEMAQFHTPDGYYGVLLHELGHWTAHPTRLDRDLSGGFGSESYAREELRAEIASFMIGQRLDIGHDPSRHASYLNSWVKVVREDPKAILKACQDAEKICGFLGVEKFEHVPTQPLEKAEQQSQELEKTSPTIAPQPIAAHATPPALVSLHAAAFAGDVDAILEHAKQGSDFNAIGEDKRGMTPAHLALSKAYAFDQVSGYWAESPKHLQAFQALLKHGAHLDVPNALGFTVEQQADRLMGLFKKGGPTTRTKLFGRGRTKTHKKEEAMAL